MSWKLRHQGSPRQTDNLSFGQVVQGLQDGLWEPTDEVMGPADRRWVPIEEHPALADYVVEEKPRLSHDDVEDRLDMNPLIDVCLVLLVFFIMTTTYQTLERVLQLPSNKAVEKRRTPEVSMDQVKQFMIMVKLENRQGVPYITLGNKLLANPTRENLAEDLILMARDTGKKEILIEDHGVDWNTAVKVVDAAGDAKITKVHFKKDKKDTPPPAPPAGG